MAAPKPKGSAHHVHDMRGTDGPGILRCASCIFRCVDEPRVLALVKSRVDLHLVVTHRSPEAMKAVYRG